MAKGRKTGGRQAGTPNAVTLTLREQVEQAAGDVPLPVLLATIGKAAMDAKDLPLALAAFSKAAPYIYPRMQAIHVENDPTVLIPPLVAHNGVVEVPKDWPGLVIEINRKILTGPDDL